MHKKLTVLFGGLVLLLVVGYVSYAYVIQSYLDNRMIPAEVSMTITNDALGLSFVYPSGGNAFALIEPPVASTSEFKQVYLLLENEAYQQYDATDSPTDAPPTVSIFVFDMPQRSDAEADAGRVSRIQNWAINHPQYSSFPLIIGEPEVVEVDGATALRYQAAGLYQQEVYLVSYRKNLFVFTGQFTDETDAIRIMFNELIDSVVLN